MNLVYSEIINTLVYLKDQLRPITTIDDLVIDPQNGKIVGILLNYQDFVVVPLDITFWNHKKMMIADSQALIPPQEVIAVDKVLKKDIWLIKMKVYTKSGKYLGKIFDYGVNVNLFSLKNIHVAKDFLSLVRFEKRIIAAEDIHEIKKNHIIVEDELALVKALDKGDPAMS